MVNFNKWIEQKRQTGSDYHIISARFWMKKGINEEYHTPLVYAAFEFRCAIERVIFELFVLMRTVGITDIEIEKIGSLKGLINTVNDLAGGNKKKLMRILLFNRISMEFSGFPKKLSIPDVGKLHKFWSKLSEYCHRQIIPDSTWDNPDWISKGYTLLEEVDNYLSLILYEQAFGFLSEENMPDEIKEQKQLFINGNIDESQLRMRFKLMQPVLESRMRKRRHSSS